MIELGQIDDCGGIYLIHCRVDRKVYVGSSIHVKTRIYEHRRALMRGAHANRHLQRAWNLHGEAAFIAEQVQHVDDESALRECEAVWIEHLEAANPSVGFNLMAAVEGGFRHSPETRARLSAILTGHKRNVGRRLSDEHKEKISAAQRGRKKDPRLVQLVAEKLRGRKASPESVAKRAAALRGRKLTAEARLNMSESAKRRGVSDAFREAGRRAAAGRKVNDETRKKISEGGKRAWIARRAKGEQK